MVSGAQAAVNCLVAEGVRLVFGYPGAAICPFYDCLAASPIRHVLTRNEQNAGHAASGYARMTGKPGVCVATSGPGATNLLTAVATAYMDSIPLVAITGQVPTGLLGRDVFQEVDVTGAAAPFTKYCYLVKDAAELPRVFKEAFHIAATGRPGPVLIDLPLDVQRGQVDFQYPAEVNIRGYKPRFSGHAVQVKRVAAAIAGAKRPLLCVGGGAQGAREAVQGFCEQTGLPVVTTMMGLGTLPTGHPLNLGMLGESGSALANWAVAQSDLLVIVGARVDDRAVASPGALEGKKTVVHIDIDSAEINKNLGTTIPLVGDAGAVLEQLAVQKPQGDWGEWRARLEERRAALPAPPAPAAGPVDPGAFVRLLSGAMEPDAVYVADVGQNQIWSAQNCLLREGRFLTSGGMGTMGYALPAALGAKLAAPGRQVVAVCGDGAFQMSMMELGTLRQQGAAVKLVVVENGCLGLVREIQEEEYGGREFAVELGGSPDIGGVAAAYGIPHLRLERMEDAPAAVDALLGAEGPFLLECVVGTRERTRRKGEKQ